MKLFAEMVTSVFSKIVGIGRVFGFNAASAVASLDRSLVARVVRDGAIAKLLERHVNRPVVQCFGADIVDAGKMNAPAKAAITNAARPTNAALGKCR